MHNRTLLGSLIGIVLGWGRTQESRRSGGAVYGLPLAVIALLGAPLIVLNLLASFVFANTAPIGLPIVMFLMLLALFVNVWTLRRVIARALVGG